MKSQFKCHHQGARKPVPAGLKPKRKYNCRLRRKHSTRANHICEGFVKYDAFKNGAKSGSILVTGLFIHRQGITLDVYPEK